MARWQSSQQDTQIAKRITQRCGQEESSRSRYAVKVGLGKSKQYPKRVGNGFGVVGCWNIEEKKAGVREEEEDVVIGNTRRLGKGAWAGGLVSRLCTGAVAVALAVLAAAVVQVPVIEPVVAGTGADWQACGRGGRRYWVGAGGPEKLGLGGLGGDFGSGSRSQLSQAQNASRNQDSPEQIRWPRRPRRRQTRGGDEGEGARLRQGLDLSLPGPGRWGVCEWALVWDMGVCPVPCVESI